VQPLRPIDWDAAHFSRDGGYKGQVLFGGESCQIIATLVPPGVEGPPTHVHPSDQIYYIVEGDLEIELGSETVRVTGGESVFIPAGLPHHNRNVSDRPETHLEVITPGVVAGKPLARFLEPDEVEAALAEAEGRGLAGLVKGPDAESTGRLFKMSWLANHASGSHHGGVYRAEMAPGAAGPTTHVHDFDQFYFVLDGSLEVEVGLQRHRVEPRTLVVLPAGVPHRQWNASDERGEEHLAILVPEPELPNSPENRWDTVVDFAVAAEQLD
jgi:mannose-6-phosphate isomerase-like protein (cupin superfamily)